MVPHWWPRRPIFALRWPHFGFWLCVILFMNCKSFDFHSCKCRCLHSFTFRFIAGLVRHGFGYKRTCTRTLSHTLLITLPRTSTLIRHHWCRQTHTHTVEISTNWQTHCHILPVLVHRLITYPFSLPVQATLPHPLDRTDSQSHYHTLIKAEA